MTYQLMQAGVVNNTTGEGIPHKNSNQDWQKFLKFADDLGLPRDAQGVPIADGVNVLAVVVPDPMIAVKAAIEAKLFETDWTQLSDAQINASVRTQYTTYRQQLRDIPSTQPGATIETAAWPILTGGRKPRRGAS